MELPKQDEIIDMEITIRIVDGQLGVSAVPSSDDNSSKQVCASILGALMASLCLAFNQSSFREVKRESIALHILNEIQKSIINNEK